MILLDTHVLVWTRAAPSRLSPAARDAIAASSRVAISGISLWEIAMLARQGRVTLDRPLAPYLEDVSASVRVLPITAAVATTVGTLPEAFPTGDPADRIIYATARAAGVPLISADRRLRDHDADVVWA